jgi:hypothetical protein
MDANEIFLLFKKKQRFFYKYYQFDLYNKVGVKI